MGLKTTYYLRSLAASQVEKSTVDTAEFGSTHKREFSTVAQDAPLPSVKAIAKNSKTCAITDPECEACQ